MYTIEEIADAQRGAAELAATLAERGIIVDQAALANLFLGLPSQSEEDVENNGANAHHLLIHIG